MATWELRNKTYRVVFMDGGLVYGYSLGDRQTAEGLCGVEKRLVLVDQKRIRVPDGADIVAFVKNGGMRKRCRSRRRCR